MDLTSDESAVEPPLDTIAFFMRLRGDSALAGALASLFLRECPRMVDEIRRAVSDGDAHALTESAHALKGSVANFYAPPTAQAAERLELMGRTGDITAAADALCTLERELARLAPALRELMA
jgi:HPt (histidine-containing phosphotransfer) domain-containing protein